MIDNLSGGIFASSLNAFLEHVLRECDVGGDGHLSRVEAVVCSQLVETLEYATFFLLQGLAGIPDLYGVCGNMYAVQYAPSAPFLGFHSPLSDRRAWVFRVQLALALMEMVESLEATPFGTLYLCDVQESNFGVVRWEGRLVAKAIDADITWFKNSLLSALASPSEREKTCSSDKDCEFINCQVVCHPATAKCSGQLSSNNLQVGVAL